MLAPGGTGPAGPDRNRTGHWGAAVPDGFLKQAGPASDPLPYANSWDHCGG